MAGELLRRRWRSAATATSASPYLRRRRRRHRATATFTAALATTAAAAIEAAAIAAIAIATAAITAAATCVAAAFTAASLAAVYCWRQRQRRAAAASRRARCGGGAMCGRELAAAAPCGRDAVTRPGVRPRVRVREAARCESAARRGHDAKPGASSRLCDAGHNSVNMVYTVRCTGAGPLFSARAANTSVGILSCAFVSVPICQLHVHRLIINRGRFLSPGHACVSAIPIAPRDGATLPLRFFCASLFTDDFTGETLQHIYAQAAKEGVLGVDPPPSASKNREAGSMDDTDRHKHAHSHARGEHEPDGPCAHVQKMGSSAADGIGKHTQHAVGSVGRRSSSLRLRSCCRARALEHVGEAVE